MSRQEDQELQRFFDREHAVRDAYDRLPKDEPPAALDAAILGAAREEAKRPVRPRWLVPMSLAATVVLGVGLSTRQLETPMQSVSDVNRDAVTYEDSSFEVSVGASSPAVEPEATRQAVARAPAPRPSVEELIRPSPMEDTDVRQARIDTDQLRERALKKTQSFTPPTLEAPPMLEAPSMAASADVAEAEFAPVPPAEHEVQDAVARNESRLLQVKRVERPIATVQAIEFQLNRLAEITGQQQAAAQEKIARSDDAAAAPESASTPIVSFEVMQGIAHDADTDSARHLGAANVQLLSNELLRNIEQLHQDGQGDEAQALFDRLITIYPQIELPDDFPFERP
ncbi:MAG: hypothetical protein AB8G17_10265 [Gammaproteobacteria bacterium]